MAKKLKLRCIRKLDNLDPVITTTHDVKIFDTCLAVLNKKEAIIVKDYNDKEFWVHWEVLDTNGNAIDLLSGREIKEHFIIIGTVT